VSADDLRGSIEDAESRLRRAIEAASSTWDKSPGGEDWAPRQIAEHAIGWLYTTASTVDKIMESSTPVDRLQNQEFSLPSAGAALDALSQSGSYDRVSDSDLEKPAPFRDNVAGVMDSAATHTIEHTDQIEESA